MSRDGRVEGRERFGRRALQAAGAAALIAVALFVVWYAATVFLLAFAGILLAVFLLIPAGWLSTHTPLPHGLALAVVVLALVALFALAGWLFAPKVVDQLTQLTQTLPQTLEQTRQRVQHYEWAQQAIAGIQSRFAGMLTTVFSGLVAFVVGVFVILAVGVAVAAEPDLYRRGLLRLVPPGRRPRADRILGAVGYALRGFLLGQLAAMAAIGLLTGFGLWLLGLPLAFTLGLLAGLLEFVPYIGPITAAVPALLVASTHGLMTVLYVLLLYYAIQQTENYLITPLVQRETISLPPALTILALILFGLLFGFLGLLLATPLLAASIVLAKTLYIEDTLGEASAMPGEPDRSPCRARRGASS